MSENFTLHSANDVAVMFDAAVAGTFTLEAETGDFVLQSPDERAFALVSENQTEIVFAVESAQGPAGAGGGVSFFLFTQAVAAAQWTVAHNLGHRPMVAVRSVGGVDVCVPEVTHLSVNTLQLDFDVPFAGEAYLI